MEQIKTLARTHNKKEISEKLNIKYSTLTAYLRRHNIQTKKAIKTFGGGRPEGAYDKKQRKRRGKTKIKGGSEYIDIDNSTDDFIKQFNEKINKIDYDIAHGKEPNETFR